MSARHNTWFVWLWMAALLSAGVGVSVQQVYCYCIGKTTVSLFAAADACQAPPPAAALEAGCCSKKGTPAKPSCCEKPDAEKKGCTKKTTKVFQLKTEFEVGKTEFKKLAAPKNWLAVAGFPAHFRPLPPIQKIDFQTFERPPPAVPGRTICLRHGVFRC